MHEPAKQYEIIMRKRKCFADKDLERLKPEKQEENSSIEFQPNLFSNERTHDHQSFNTMMQFYSMILSQFTQKQNCAINQFQHNDSFNIDQEITLRNNRENDPDDASKKRSDHGKNLTNFSVEALLKFI